jgi:hypothetical protein
MARKADREGELGKGSSKGWKARGQREGKRKERVGVIVRRRTLK